MIKNYFFSLLLLLSACTNDSSNTLIIASATNFQFPLETIVKKFQKKHPVPVSIVVGSSGNLFAQIKAGAPYHIFLSADSNYPTLLYKDQIALKPAVYATGNLVLWWRKELKFPKKLEILSNTKVGKISIADPAHAPYGKRAKEFLKRYKLWSKVQHKLVMGKNVAQAAQFAHVGNSQIGIIPESIAVIPKFKNSGRYYQINSQTHLPLKQSFAIIKPKHKSAKTFAKFLKSNQIQKIICSFGYK